MKFGLTEQDILQIAGALARVPQIEEAVIFGSRAKGNCRDGSDIDLAIKGDGITDSIVSHVKDWLEEELPLPYFFDVVDYGGIQNQNLLIMM